MRFVQTEILGAFVVAPEPIFDDRGLFARIWCEREFAEHGIAMTIRQCSVSVNRRRGTMRGLHFQETPHAETRVVRCTSGAIYDVIVDLRSESPSFRRWIGVELTQENRTMVYVPEGCAHGFLTLVDNVEVFYQMSAFYSAPHAQGVRWNDPAFAIAWPSEIVVISERDRNFPDFARE
jgi:dTDP-4-dehydrorhamnose 3,5-epimerase